MDHLILGIDVDGVVADFVDAYRYLCQHLVGKPLPERPACWDFPQAAGYTEAEVERVWAYIHANPEWWDTLRPLAGPLVWPGADVYYITARPRVPRTLSITESWVRRCVDPKARVLLAPDKGAAAKALRLTHYIDDRPENLLAVRKASKDTLVTLRRQPWNEGSPLFKDKAVAGLVGWPPPVVAEEE